MYKFKAIGIRTVCCLNNSSAHGYFLRGYFGYCYHVRVVAVQFVVFVYAGSSEICACCQRVSFVFDIVGSSFVANGNQTLVINVFQGYLLREISSISLISICPTSYSEAITAIFYYSVHATIFPCYIRKVHAQFSLVYYNAALLVCLQYIVACFASSICQNQIIQAQAVRIAGSIGICCISVIAVSFICTVRNHITIFVQNAACVQRKGFSVCSLSFKASAAHKIKLFTSAAISSLHYYVVHCNDFRGNFGFARSNRSKFVVFTYAVSFSISSKAYIFPLYSQIIVSQSSICISLYVVSLAIVCYQTFVDDIVKCYAVLQCRYITTITISPTCYIEQITTVINFFSYTAIYSFNISQSYIQLRLIYCNNSILKTNFIIISIQSINKIKT